MMKGMQGTVSSIIQPGTCSVNAGLEAKPVQS